MAKMYFSDEEIKNGRAAAQLATAQAKNPNSVTTAPQITAGSNPVNPTVLTPTSSLTGLSTGTPSNSNNQATVVAPQKIGTYTPVSATREVAPTPTYTAPAPVKITEPPSPVAPTPYAPVATPTPIYDYKTDPTFLSWKANYDATQAKNLEQANKTWQEKYGGLQTDYQKATTELNELKPFKDKFNQTQSQLTATQANFDDLNNRFSALQKKQVSTLDNQQATTPNASAAANMANYNDKRDASGDQWWSKYLGAGRR